MTKTEMLDILEKLGSYENILIFGHTHPDGDCAGSAVALAGLCEALGGKAEVMFPEPLPLRLRFLLGDRPERTELPDLSAYTIVTVDVAAPMQLGDLRETLADKVELRIDHHGRGVSYAKHEYVDPSAAAAGEIVFDLCEEALASGKVKSLPADVYAALFGAISSDTGGFRYSNVTPATHLRAAKLLEYGVPAAKINQLLFSTKSKEEVFAEGLVQSRMRLFADGQISGVAIGREAYANGVEMSDFETAVDIARSLRGVKVAIAIKEAPRGGVHRASLRGNDGVNVCRVAECFGGGGHVAAAGCSVEANSPDEALEKVVAKVKELCL